MLESGVTITPATTPARQLALDFEARVDQANAETHGLLREIRAGLSELGSWLRGILAERPSKRRRAPTKTSAARRDELEEKGRRILAWVDRLDHREADAFLAECARDMGPLASAWNVRRALEKGVERPTEFAARLVACRRIPK